MNVNPKTLLFEDLEDNDASRLTYLATALLAGKVSIENRWRDPFIVMWGDALDKKEFNNDIVKLDNSNFIHTFSAYSLASTAKYFEDVYEEEHMNRKH